MFVLNPPKSIAPCLAHLPTTSFTLTARRLRSEPNLASMLFLSRTVASSLAVASMIFVASPASFASFARSRSLSAFSRMASEFFRACDAASCSFLNAPLSSGTPMVPLLSLSRLSKSVSTSLMSIFSAFAPFSAFSSFVSRYLRTCWRNSILLIGSSPRFAQLATNSATFV